MSTDPENTISARSHDDQPSHLHSSLFSQQNLFDRLATETIGHIFTYACPTLDLPARILQDDHRIKDSYSDPAMLSMVCKRWHAISLSNHSLWATITIETLRIHEKDWFRAGFSQLRRFLENAGTYPLNICIYGGPTDDLVISSILDIIMMCSERWRSITLAFSLGSKFVQQLNTLIGCLPLLEHLEVDLSDFRYSEDMPECTAFLSAPQLKSLCITSIPLSGPDIFGPISIPGTQITEVMFRGCDFHDEEDFQDLLGWLSVSLTSLTFSESFDTQDWPGPLSRNVTLPQLRRLRVLYDCSDVLDRLICPSLEQLEIFSAREGTITKFLDYSSCSLTHFKLCSLRNYSPTTCETLLKHSSLSTLRFISLAEITNPALDLLNFNSHQMFPSLQILHLYFRITRWNYNPYPRQLQHRIEKLRNVLYSRTHVRSFGQESDESLNDGAQSIEIQRIARSSLEKCLFYFNLELDGPDEDDYWDEEPITALRSFCVSQKMLVALEIFYSWDLTDVSRSDDGDFNMDWDLKFP